jgi:hypothetical protein
MATNLYAPPKAQVADIAAGEAAPALWNPGAAASWSLLFTPVFGALLHRKNWLALGEPQKAAAAKTWIFVYIVTIVGLTLLGVFMPGRMEVMGLLRLSGFALLLAWYYASGKPQVDFVKTRYGKDYPRKGWGQPILIAVGALIAFFVVCFVLGFIAAVIAAAIRRA